MSERRQASAKDPDAPLSDRERELIARLFRWEELPSGFRAALTDYVSVNGSLHVSSMPTLKGEEWREVDATGQPAFENSWSNLGAGEATAAFYRDSLGLVHIKAGITSPAGAGTGNGTTAFTLPEGYRPPLNERFAVRGNSGGGLAGVAIIGSDGTVSFTLDGVAANAVVTDVYLSCSFRAA